MQQIMDFLNRTQQITQADLKLGHNRDYLFKNATEELGEYAAATTIEDGIKNKPLKETAKQEAVDVVICALSLFYTEGGTNEELAEYGQFKLNKWEGRVRREGYGLKPGTNMPKSYASVLEMVEDLSPDNPELIEHVRKHSIKINKAIKIAKEKGLTGEELIRFLEESSRAEV